MVIKKIGGKIILGFYSSKTYGGLKRMTHPGTFLYFNFNAPEYKENCNGALNGWNKNVPEAYQVFLFLEHYLTFF